MGLGDAGGAGDLASKVAPHGDGEGTVGATGITATPPVLAPDPAPVGSAGLVPPGICHQGGQKQPKPPQFSPAPSPKRLCEGGQGHTVPRTITARSHPAPGRGRWLGGHTGCHPRVGARWVPAPPGCVLPAPSSRWDRADGVPKWLLERRGRARCAGTNRASQGFSDITTNPTNPRAALPRRLKINA